MSPQDTAYRQDREEMRRAKESVHAALDALPISIHDREAVRAKIGTYVDAVVGCRDSYRDAHEQEGGAR